MRLLAFAVLLVCVNWSGHIPALAQSVTLDVAVERCLNDAHRESAIRYCNQALEEDRKGNVDLGVGLRVRLLVAKAKGLTAMLTRMGPNLSVSDFARSEGRQLLATFCEAQSITLQAGGEKYIGEVKAELLRRLTARMNSDAEKVETARLLSDCE